MTPVIPGCTEGADPESGGNRIEIPGFPLRAAVE
jgi:hypothetical protein